MIASFVSDKLSDSPVVVADEAGTFVIPLLSGHMGGPMSLQNRLQDRLEGFRSSQRNRCESYFFCGFVCKKCGLSIYNREGSQKFQPKYWMEKRRIL